MANRIKGEVEIVLGDGQTYIITFSTNALCALENELGVEVAEIGKIMQQDVRLNTVRSILFAALQDHHGHELRSSADVGRLMNVQHLPDYGAKIGEAFTLAFPQAGGASGDARPRKAKAAARGTGKRS